jgi:hypothetical protein
MIGSGTGQVYLKRAQRDSKVEERQRVADRQLGIARKEQEDRKAEKLGAIQQELESASSRLALDQDQKQFQEMFRSLLNVAKADRKLSDWMEVISSLSPDWLNRVETFAAIAELLPQQQWDPATVCPLAGPAICSSTDLLLKFAQLKWRHRSAEPFNKMVPDEKWSDIDFVLKWVACFGSKIWEFFKHLENRPYLSDVTQMKRLFDAFPVCDYWETVIGICDLLAPSVWQNASLVSQWVAHVPREMVSKPGLAHQI